MKFKDTFIFERVYFDDPETGQHGMGYIRCRSGNERDNVLEVLPETKSTGFFKGYPTAVVSRRPVEVSAKHVVHRGRAVSFFDMDSHCLKPIYEPWPDA